jgi:hypothetical protein
MKEWTEVIRDERYFNLLVANTESNETRLFFAIKASTGSITVQYERIYKIADTMGLENAPSHIAASDVQYHATSQSTENDIIPHAADPAPAQRAGNIAFIWADNKSKHRDTILTPVRADGFPAVVMAVNLNKHYKQGQLHRKGSLPAIKAEYMSALWYTEPYKQYRPDGPSGITLENYHEFWVNGEFKGNRWANYGQQWCTRDEDKIDAFLDNLKGNTNMFGVPYFTNPEDEVCYITDFA